MIDADVITELGTDLTGYQEFKSTTDPSASVAGAYTFKIAVNGTTLNTGNDISVTLTNTEALASIATKIATAVNAISAASVSCAVNATSLKVRVTSTSTTQLSASISLSAPTAGSSLLTLLGGVETAVTKPQIVSGHVQHQTKTLPAVVVTMANQDFRIAALDFSTASIRTSAFSIRVHGGSKSVSESIASDVRTSINTKTIAGGWWQIESICPDQGDAQTVFNLFGREHLFYAKLGYN